MSVYIYFYIETIIIVYNPIFLQFLLNYKNKNVNECVFFI